MHRILFWKILGVVFLFASHLSAQDSTRVSDASLAYWGHGIIRPGIKGGVTLVLKEYENSKSLLLRPSFAAYTRPNFYASFMPQVEMILYRNKPEKNWYTEYALGTAYLLTYEVTGVTVGLNGEIVEKERDQRHFFLPTVSYRKGKRISDKLSVYAGGSYGMQFSSRFESAGQFYWELGMKYHFYKTSQP